MRLTLIDTECEAIFTMPANKLTAKKIDRPIVILLNNKEIRDTTPRTFPKNLYMSARFDTFVDAALRNEPANQPITI